MPKFVIQDYHGLKLIRFSVFQSFENLNVCFSTRIGGVSPKPYDGLNLGLGTEDSRENVLENRKKLWEAIGADESRVVRQEQIHGADIHYVETPGLKTCTDAMFTDQPNLFLTVAAADCVPILFYEPVKQIAGVIHAGWRGTAGNIAEKTMLEVKKYSGADLSNVIAVIGPSISVDSYEVGDEVAKEFMPGFVRRNGGEKPHLDLWKANAAQLEAVGVKEIVISGLCTVKRQDLFFSHRGSGGKTGRMLGVIGMK